MDGAWLAAGHFAAAALLLLLAAIMLWVDAASRAVWAFVAFLVLRAGVLTLLWLSYVVPDPRGILGNVVTYYDIAAAGAILCLYALYPKRRSPGWLVVVVAGVLAAEWTWAFARCAIGCEESGPGPLRFLFAPTVLVAGIVALALSLASRRMPEGTRRTSVRIVAVGLAIESALYGGISVGLPLGAIYPWDVAVAGAAALVVAATLRGKARIALLVVVALAFASGVLGVRILGDERMLLYGAWRLVLPLLLGYALARHRLLDLDLRVKLAARRATLGAIFAGVFFVVTEGGAYALGSTFGVLAGILAVGALVPLLGPLRRAAERVTSLLPGEEGVPRELPLERRQRIYHEFAVQAWSDGRLARNERVFLDQLRERLALPAEDAMRIETDASQHVRIG